MIIPILPIMMLSACGTRPGHSENIEQGLAGEVVWVEGNRMPSPDMKADPPKGVQCKIYIHTLTGPGDAETEPDSPSFYKKINTPLIKSFESAKNGSFAVALPEGEYSVFMGVDSLFYANISDQHGNINPVKVLKDSLTTIRLSLDYKAVY